MPPTTSFPPVTYGPDGNLYPSLVNGLPLNLPAGTTLGGGTVPLLGIGGRLANSVMPLGPILYDGAGTPKLAANFNTRELFDSDGTSLVSWTDTGLLAVDGNLTASAFFGDGVGISNLYGLTLAANQSVRRNAGNSAYEAFVAQATNGNLGLAGFSSITGRLGSANLPLGAQLYDNAGTPLLAIDVANRELRNSAGFEVFDFEGSYWYDPSGLAFIDSGNRYFYGPDGTTIAMTLGASEITFFGGNFTVHATGNIDGANANMQLWDGSNITVNSASRQLIANDGSTVALDWSNPTSIALFTDVVTFSNDGQASFANGSTVIDADGIHGILLVDSTTYVDNGGFHGIGAVIAGTKTATGTATTTFTVTIGVTMANNTYKVTTEGDNALSSAVHYVQNKTTTTFDIVYLAGLTGSVAVDWIVSP